MTDEGPCSISNSPARVIQLHNDQQIGLLKNTTMATSTELSTDWKEHEFTAYKYENRIYDNVDSQYKTNKYI
jgi:hypothetical protein